MAYIDKVTSKPSDFPGIDIHDNTITLPSGDTVNYTDIDVDSRTLHIYNDGDEIYSVDYGDQYITVIDNSTGDVSYIYYTIDIGGNPGLVNADDIPDYTIILQNILQQIQIEVSKTESIRLTDVEIQRILSLLDSRVEDSVTYLQLMYDSIQLVQTDVNTCADNTQYILNVSQDILTYTQNIDQACTQLQIYLNNINNNLVDPEDDEPWLKKIYHAILGLSGDDNTPIEIDIPSSGDEDPKEEMDTSDFFTDLLSKFNWVWQIKTVFEQLVRDITNDAASAEAVSNGSVETRSLSSAHAPARGAAEATAPELALRLGSTEALGGLDLSDQSIIDLSWYAPYKDQVDGLLSGFLWLGFVWLLIKRLPGIIHGAEMVTEDSYKISLGR